MIASSQQERNNSSRETGMAEVKLVVFDVGETLVDETRHWSEWADWLHVPRFTFMAALGFLIGNGRSHRDVFPLVSPYTASEATARRTAEGWRYNIWDTDLYPDALPCLSRLRRYGYRVAIVGNQPIECENALRALGLAANWFGSSARWGIEKPSQAFFERVVEVAGLPAKQIVYVGDHPENDITSAQACGLRTVFLRRGPWAIAHEFSAAAKLADLTISSLDALPGEFEKIASR
jgi:HAD superfamily hydrolase (TIGR01549 family)